MPLEAGRRLAAGLPQARFMTLEGKAHPPWVDGRAIADIVHSFFAGEDPLAPASSPAFPTGRAIDCRLDEANRELVLEGRREPITPLEYGVMLALVRASGRVVTRDEMLAEVWRTSFAGSNRVRGGGAVTAEEARGFRSFDRNGDGPRLPVQRVEAADLKTAA